MEPPSVQEPILTTAAPNTPRPGPDDPVFGRAYARVHESAGRRLVRLAPWIGAYALYSLFHVAICWALGMRSLLRAKKRGHVGVVLTRLLGGTKPTRKARWTVVLAGGLGEKRAAFAFAEKVRDQRTKDVAVCVQSSNAVGITHATIDSGVLPFNNPISVLIFLWRWRPKALIAVEFWDNHHLVALSSILGVKTAIFNVPITYQATRHIAPQARWRNKFVGAYCCQGKIHVKRLRYAGVPDDALVLTGPIGIAVDPVQGLTETPAEVKARYQREFHLTQDHFPVIVTGSTYRADEDVILDAFAMVRERYPNAILILAPRLVNRPGGCDSVLVERGISFVRRTVPFSKVPDSGVILIDKVGELKYLYALGQIAFVGGTMGQQGSGHTPVEANAWRLPITIGPDFPQQKIVMDMLLKEGIAVVCQNGEELGQAWLDLTADENRRKAIADRTERLFGDQDDMVLRVFDNLLS